MKNCKSIDLRGLLFCAIFMIVTDTLSGTHQLNVGPREGFYLSKDDAYKDFSTGITIGYQYSLLAADMFRVSFGSDNSINIVNGNSKEGGYNVFGVNAFVEPGVEMLFYLLMPFTARMQAGISYLSDISKISVNADNLRGSSGDNIEELRFSSNRFGMYFSPGLFFQTNRGHIGAFTKQRFHLGVNRYDDGSSDISSKMFDWGIQGGFITGKLSHTIIIESSRTVAKMKNSDVWPDWNGVPPERRFSYTIGINIPRVLKMEKPGEKKMGQQRTMDPAPKKTSESPKEERPLIQQDTPASSTPIPETSINLQGDIFKPRCISECQSSSTMAEKCSQLVQDAWYDAVAAKSHYMASSTESNQDVYIKAISTLKSLCPDACK